MRKGITILSVYNRYLNRGGEDEVFESEAALLGAHGCAVRCVTEHVSKPCDTYHAFELARDTVWCSRWYHQITGLLREVNPDAVHLHNFFPVISPSIYYACRKAGVPLVHTLHNYRFLCPGNLLLRNGSPCEDCVGKRYPWPGVVHACYQGSRLKTGVIAAMLGIHNWARTWHEHVDVFVALTEMARRKFAAGGLPTGRIVVKPNFVEDPGQPASAASASNVVLYAGRLSKEKGVAALLSAWAGAALGRHGRLVIAGEGPERATLEGQASLLGLSPPEVTFAGYQPAPKLHALIEGSRAMVVPSIWYETFGRVVIEAFCHARPVVVSDIGAIGELVHHGGTGLKFPPGDAAALGEALRTILGDGSLADRLGVNARAEYLAKYTPERNFEMLMRIYRFAIERKGNAVPEMLRSFEPATPTVHKEPAEVAHA